VNNDNNDRHYSAAELAGLPGLPTTEQGVRLRAGKENWHGRKRVGRGGGTEYRLSYLPPEAREHLAALELKQRPDAPALEQAARKAALLNTIEGKAKQALLERGLAKAAALSGRDALRVETKLAVLSAFEQFHRTARLPLTHALHAFATEYNAGRVSISSEAKPALVAPATLYSWRQVLKTGGVSALAGNYGNRKGSGAIDSQTDIREYLIAAIAEYPHGAATHFWKGLKARFKSRDDVRLPTKRSLQRWIKTWKREHSQLFESLRNPDAWRGRYMTAMGSASESIERPNQLWEFDATPGDLMLTDGRHVCVGVIDVYPRRGKLLVVKTSKAAAIATLARRALLDWGVPEEAKTDQGAEFIGKHVSMVFEGLEITHTLCPPFRGDRKPHIERFFRTFAHDLVELLPGFIGHNVAERKAIEERASFSERLLKKDGLLEVSLSSADFQRICDQWCDKVYEHQAHEGLGGKTPFELVAGWTGEVRRIQDERALDVLLAAPAGNGLRVVQKKGVEFDGTWFIHPSVGLHVGQQVRIKHDPIDLGRLHVSDLNGHFLFWAEAPERTGINRRDVAMKGQQLQRQAVQEARRAVKATARRLRTADIVSEILADKAEAAGKLKRLPGASKLHSTAALLHSTAALSQAAVASRAHRAPERTVNEAEIAAARQRLAEKQSSSATVTQLQETPRQRMRRWLALDRQLRLGASLSAEEADFHELYQGSNEFRSQRREGPYNQEGNEQERQA